MENVLLKEINYFSYEYESELELRDKVLRRPLGLSLYSENHNGEKNDTHIGAFKNGKLIGVLILSRISEDDYKMRQVAVDIACQGKGIGKRLVRYAEELVRNNGAHHICLHARKTAIPFYEKLGYQTEGEEFTEVTIPHKAMIKHL